MVNVKQSLKSFTRNFYLYKFFNDFAFIYAVYLVLFQIKGLSVLEISLLLALWSSVVVLLEVPTGTLADKWNRKSMLIIGQLCKALGFFIWLFANNFWLFALGFLLWGIQSTFTSGTAEALLYDNLKKFKSEKNYSKISGHGNFYAKIAIGVSVLLGGFIANYSFSLTIVSSSIFILISIIPLLFLHEVKARKTSTEETKYLDYIKDAFKQTAKNKYLLNLIVYSIIVLGVVNTLEEYQQLFFGWVNVPLAFFGVVGTTIFIVMAIGAKFAYKFQNIEKNIYLFSLIAGICLIISVFAQSLFLLIPFALIFLLVSVSEVILETNLQQQIKSHQRATILSINSLLLNLSAIILTVLFGILSKIGNLTWGFLAFGIIMVVYSLFFVFRKKSIGHKKNHNTK